METVFYETPLALHKPWYWQEPQDWIRVLRNYDREAFTRRRPPPAEPEKGKEEKGMDPPPATSPAIAVAPKLPNVWKDVCWLIACSFILRDSQANDSRYPPLQISSEFAQRTKQHPEVRTAVNAVAEADERRGLCRVASHFMCSSCCNVMHQVFRSISGETDRYAVIVEPRPCDDLLESVLRNVMFYLAPKGWGLLIVHSAGESKALRWNRMGASLNTLRY